MRLMLLGAGGMLGHDLLLTAPRDVTMLPFVRSALDVTDNTAVEAKVAELVPDIIINAAAYSAVDRAEAEHELAFRVNAQAAGNVARIAYEHRARLIHFSTDYVFDGSSQAPYKESDEANPLNAYGASKLEGERRVAASGAAHLVIRTQWLFSAQGRSFPRTMWERAVAGVPTRAVEDQVGRPTYTTDLAHAMWTLIAAQASGVIHVANSGHATRYDLARRIFETAGAGSLVCPCSTHAFPRPARRPPRVVLDTQKYERLVGQPLPSWQNALDRFLALQLRPGDVSTQ